MFIWIFAAIVVFLISLVIAVVSVEKEKSIDVTNENNSVDLGDGALLAKPIEKPFIGHGKVVEVLGPSESVPMLDDNEHSHQTIVTESDHTINTLEPAQKESVDTEDEIVPRYLEEEMNDREQSKKLAGEIDL